MIYYADFENIWLKVFGKCGKEHEQACLSIVAELRAAGIIKTEPEAFQLQECLAKWHFADDQSHRAEFDKMAHLLAAKGVIATTPGIESAYKLKVSMEKDIICWLIDLDKTKFIKDIIAFLLRLEFQPKHFSDISCQCLYRIIISRHRDGLSCSLEDILALLRTQPGYIDNKDFAEVYVKEYQKPVEDGEILIITYAQEVIKLSEMIKEHQERSEKELEPLTREFKIKPEPEPQIKKGE